MKANCAAGTSSYTLTQFTTTAASVSCPGLSDVSTNGTTGGAAQISLNTDVYGTINARGDIDYYKFTVATGGTITISLTNLPADYQLDLIVNGTTISSTNGGTTSETINATVSATPAGAYYYARVYPKNNGAFNASSCYTLRVQTGTASRGADEITNSGKKFIVSPNPAGYKVNLAINVPVSGNAIITVTNQTGQVVTRKTLAVNAGDNIRNLDVSNLNNGMYFIKVQTGSIVQMAKLVVSK